MNPNPFLVPYTSDEINVLIQSGSIIPTYDDSFNLMIEHSQVSMTSSSITIPLTKDIFSDTKVETKFNVLFSELT